MDSPEARVRRMADKQQGTVSRNQALAAGMTDRTIQRRSADGVWTRLSNGIFLLFGKPSVTTRLIAATVALPAVISHESAAFIHQLTVGQKEVATVTITHRFSNRFPGVTVHESTDLAEHHMEIRQGLPVTTVARTIFDLAVGVSPRSLRRAVDDALVRRCVEICDLRRVFGDVGRRERPGTTAMRSLLESMTDDYVAPESELERWLVELLDRSDLPSPTLQMALTWRTAVAGRVDVAYPDERILIECDGRRWHTLAESFERDRRRVNLAQIEGWTVLRFTWDDVVEHPARTLSMVRAAFLARAA